MKSMGKSRHPGFDNVFREATHEDQRTFDMTPTRKPGSVNYEKWYRALKEHDADTYKTTLEYMEGVTLNFSTPTHVAAEYEFAAVMLACRILGIKP